MLFTILDTILNDFSNFYFFILPTNGILNHFSEKKVTKTLKILVRKLFVLDLVEIYTKSGRKFFNDLNLFFDTITNSRDSDFPLKYVLIKNFENISIEKQLFLKYFIEKKGNNIRLIFIGKKIKKINPILIAKGLLINLEKNSDKKRIETKKKIKKFFLKRRLNLFKFYKKKEYLKNFDSFFFFVSTFFSKIEKKLKQNFFFPNEIFFFFFENLESKDFEKNLKIGMNSFSNLVLKNFSLECLEYSFLQKKDLNFLFFLKYQFLKDNYLKTI